MVGTPMVGAQAQARQAQHRIGAHLWNGLSTVRVNCETAIVGTPLQVTDEIFAYWRFGFDAFILSRFPHLEECLRGSQVGQSRCGGDEHPVERETELAGRWGRARPKHSHQQEWCVRGGGSAQCRRRPGLSVC